MKIKNIFDNNKSKALLATIKIIFIVDNRRPNLCPFSQSQKGSFQGEFIVGPKSPEFALLQIIHCCIFVDCAIPDLHEHGQRAVREPQRGQAAAGD